MGYKWDYGGALNAYLAVVEAVIWKGEGRFEGPDLLLSEDEGFFELGKVAAPGAFGFVGDAGLRLEDEFPAVKVE